jgi:hypothetical protein
MTKTDITKFWAKFDRVRVGNMSLEPKSLRRTNDFVTTLEMENDLVQINQKLNVPISSLFQTVAASLAVAVDVDVVVFDVDAAFVALMERNQL